MIIQGALSGSDVLLHFYDQDDLRMGDYGSEMQPETWIQLIISEDEARALLGWLSGDQSADFRSSRLAARGSRDWLIIEGSASEFVIRLGTTDMVASVAREISLALSLVIGRPVDD
jgi:hypothetical protein